MPSLTNLRPGIIQSHDKHVLILLYPPYLFTAKDSIEAVKARLNRLDEMYASKDSIQYCHDVIDFNKYSPNKRHRYYMQDYSDRIELYPSKIAKAFSMLILCSFGDGLRKKQISYFWQIL